MLTEKEVFIGRKPFMLYVSAIVMNLTKSDINKLIIKSRGGLIPKTIGIIFYALKNLQGVFIDDVKIGVDVIRDCERVFDVATIEVMLRKTIINNK